MHCTRTAFDPKRTRSSPSGVTLSVNAKLFAISCDGPKVAEATALLTEADAVAAHSVPIGSKTTEAIGHATLM